MLESEIHSRTGHAKVIVRSINKVPAEITDQANVWREADFYAAADLADSAGFAVRMTNGLELVEAFAGFKNPPIHSLLTATKDSAACHQKCRAKTGCRGSDNAA